MVKCTIIYARGVIIMGNLFYIYRFLDCENNVIYIGRTNDINRRILKEHFT